MHVVVTGSAGFVGRHLVAALVARGVPVVGVDRRPQRRGPGFTPVQADVLDAHPTMTAAFTGATAVYHLAGCPGVRDDSPATRRRRQRDNVLATERVLSLVPFEVPVLVCSSSSVYGGSRGKPSTETDDLDPLGGYARSKVAVEVLCERRRAEGGRVSVVRPFTVVGPGQRPDMAIARWLRAASARRPLTVLGGLERTRDLTDVRQVARVFVDVVERGVDDVVNVGTGHPQSLARVVEAVADAVGHDVDVVVVPAARREPAHTWADTTRLRKVVGYAPCTDLTEVVASQLRDAVEVRLSA